MSISPQRERSAQATEAIIREAERKWGLLRASELPSDFAPQPLNCAQLLAIAVRDETRYPGFQFDASGQTTSEIAQLLEESGKHDWSDWDLFLWLVLPSSRLDGAVPADLLVAGMNREKVVSAAELEMQLDW